MSECIVRIERLQNGYEVEVIDEKIQDENMKPRAAWKDPWKGYAFTDVKEVVAFLTKHLDSLPVEKDDYATSFNKATAEDKD
jgi:hypothetical protein